MPTRFQENVYPTRLLGTFLPVYLIFKNIPLYPLIRVYPFIRHLRVFVFRFSGEGAWYMYQSQGIASLSDRTLGSIDPSQCVLLCPLN